MTDEETPCSQCGGPRTIVPGHQAFGVPYAVCTLCLFGEGIEGEHSQMQADEHNERVRKEAEMGITKHGSGEILPDADQQKTAAKEEWTEEDAEALEQESAE